MSKMMALGMKNNFFSLLRVTTLTASEF